MENSTFYPVNDCRYLAHHGVKGMKWGVRHDKYPGYKRLKRKDFRKITNKRSKEYDKTKESIKYNAKRDKLEKEIDAAWNKMGDTGHHYSKDTKLWNNYINLDNKLMFMDEKYNKLRDAYVYGDLIKEYGDQQISDLRYSETTRAGLGVITTFLAVPAISGAALVGVGAYLANRKR